MVREQSSDLVWARSLIELRENLNLNRVVADAKLKVVLQTALCPIDKVIAIA